MEVDFLSEDERGVLFKSKDKVEEPPSADEADEAKTDDAAVDNPSKEESNESGDASRPSLHPIAIDAIEDVLRLRVQNSTTLPL